MMKKVNKRVYAATLMALLSIAVNGYAANVTTNNNEEDITMVLAVPILVAWIVVRIFAALIGAPLFSSTAYL